MTKYRSVRYVRDPDDGSGVNGVTVALKLHADDSTVASDSTDAAGRAEFAHDTVGYPGPVYETATSGGTTRVVSGNVWGQLGGLIWPDDIPDVFSTLGIGVVTGAGSEFAATGTGSNRIITIQPGMAILKDGIPYVLDASTTVTPGAGDATHPRIDRVVLRLTREEQAAQGKIVLTVIAGTPAASPSAPALTQTSATWDFSLFQVAVAAGATTLNTANITSEQTYCFTYPLTTAGDLLYVASTGKPARLAVGSTGQILVVSGGAPSWGTIGANNIGAGTVDNTEFGYLNGVTSAIQTQLNDKVDNDGDTIAGSLAITGSLTIDGPFRDNSGTGWTSAEQAGFGTSPGAATRDGNEYAGRIVQTTGSSATNPGALWTVTFANARATGNYTVFIASGNDDTAALLPYVSSTSTTGFTIACVNDPPNSTSLRVSWFIVDRA